MKQKNGYVLCIVLILCFVCSLLVTTQLSKLITQQKNNAFFLTLSN